MIEQNPANDSWWAGKYLDFVDKGYLVVGGKTRLYEVRNKSNILLGHIKWNGQWRKYVLHTLDSIMFDERCLTEVSSFLKQQTTAQKNRIIPIDEKLERERRKELYRKNRLTKEAKSGRLENETVPVPEKQVVEGGQTLTPLEVELGVIDIK